MTKRKHARHIDEIVENHNHGQDEEGTMKLARLEAGLNFGDGIAPSKRIHSLAESARFRQNVQLIAEIIDSKLYLNRKKNLVDYFRCYHSVSKAHAYRLKGCLPVLQALAEVSPITPVGEVLCTHIKSTSPDPADWKRMWLHVLQTKGIERINDLTYVNITPTDVYSAWNSLSDSSTTDVQSPCARSGYLVSDHALASKDQPAEANESQVYSRLIKGKSTTLMAPEMNCPFVTPVKLQATSAHFYAPISSGTPLFYSIPSSEDTIRISHGSIQLNEVTLGIEQFSSPGRYFPDFTSNEAGMHAFSFNLSSTLNDESFSLHSFSTERSKYE